MNSRALLLLLFVFASGCLYTNKQVQRKFTLQIRHTGGIIAIANKTEKGFEVCDFGTTEETCTSPKGLARGETMSLPYRTGTLLPPVPDAMCPVKRCVTGDWDAQDDGKLSENTPYVQIDNQQGLVVSIRETGASRANQLVATADFRVGEGCFIVTLLPAPDDNVVVSKTEDVLGKDGSTIALSTWNKTACAQGASPNP